MHYGKGQMHFLRLFNLEPSYVHWTFLDGWQEVLAAQIAWQEEKAQIQVSGCYLLLWCACLT